MLLRTAPKNELVAAMAWLTMPALLGPVLGPPVGGFIVTYFDWRWIFDINVPIGILGHRPGQLFVEDVREPPRGRFDGIGPAAVRRGAVGADVRAGDRWAAASWRRG